MDYVVNGKDYVINNSELVVLCILTIWSYCWKIPAIWRSVKSGNKKWFIAFIFINTFGILEIAYLMYFSEKPKPKE
jgi:hypothetical protein